MIYQACVGLRRFNQSESLEGAFTSGSTSYGRQSKLPLKIHLFSLVLLFYYELPVGVSIRDV